MRIIVAGGTGLIGRALLAELTAAGHTTWILSRREQPEGLPPEVQAVQWDGRTPKGWGHLVENADAIINLSGENIGAGRWTAQRKRRIVTSRAEAGQAIVAALEAARRRPRLMLQASAIGYYGFSGERVVTEEDPPGSDYLSEVCVAWEGSTAAAERLGMRHVVVRTGLVLSRKDGFMDPLLLQYRLFAGGPLGSGRQWWSWIHLRDEVRALRFLIELDAAQGPYNLAAPNPVRMSEFGRVLARVMRRPYLIPAPAFVLKLILGEMSQLVLKGQRVLPTRLLQAGFQFDFDDLQPALADVLSQPG